VCLAIPAKVVSIEQDFAQVDMGGNRLKISTLLLDQVAIGDYVIVHAGFAIHKVDEQEAQESLKLLRELATVSV